MQFSRQLARQRWNYFCCSEVRCSHRATRSEQIAIICAGKAWEKSQLVRRPVGFTKKDSWAEKYFVARSWKGVTLCNSGCKVLQMLREVDRTGFYFVQHCAQQQRACVASQGGTLLHLAHYFQQLATCVALQYSWWTNCAVLNRTSRAI